MDFTNQQTVLLEDNMKNLKIEYSGLSFDELTKAKKENPGSKVSFSEGEGGKIIIEHSIPDNNEHAILGAIETIEKLLK